MEINGLIIESVVVGSVGTNCYIVHKKDSEHCFVVDPGDSGDKIANLSLIHISEPTRH